MTPYLKELERLARAAQGVTNEPWWTFEELDMYSTEFAEEHSAYIAAANPAAILSLIQELTRPETTIVSIMRAELEQARKDAERYQWLRHGDNDEKVLCNGPVDMTYWYLLRNEKLDEAIDAAIAKEQAK